jgi:hypothetical protein
VAFEVAFNFIRPTPSLEKIGYFVSKLKQGKAHRLTNMLISNMQMSVLVNKEY